MQFSTGNWRVRSLPLCRSTPCTSLGFRRVHRPRLPLVRHDPLDRAFRKSIHEECEYHPRTGRRNDCRWSYRLRRRFKHHVCTRDHLHLDAYFQAQDLCPCYLAVASGLRFARYGGNGRHHRKLRGFEGTCPGPAVRLTNSGRYPGGRIQLHAIMPNDGESKGAIMSRS